MCYYFVVPFPFFNCQKNRIKSGILLASTLFMALFISFVTHTVQIVNMANRLPISIARFLFYVIFHREIYRCLLFRGGVSLMFVREFARDPLPEAAEKK